MYKKEEIESLIEKLEDIKKFALKLERKFSDELSMVNDSYRKSASNLLSYIALRNSEHKNMRSKLGEIGTSRLAKAEENVLYTINSVLNILYKLIDKDIFYELGNAKEGRAILHLNSDALLGKNNSKRKVRIMATVPDDADTNYDAIKELVLAGVNCFRINCALQDKYIWKNMIANINKAKYETGANCKILMDLGGTKIRTGKMAKGPQIIHLQPEKDDFGITTKPLFIWMGNSAGSLTDHSLIHLPIDCDNYKNMKKGHRIEFTDTRGKEVSVKILEVKKDGFIAKCDESCYIIKGTKLNFYNNKKKKYLEARVGGLKPIEKYLLLQKGDTLILHAGTENGEPAKFNKLGEVEKPAHISLGIAEVFSDVRAGESILFDDGKIEGIIKSVSMQAMEVQITYTKPGGAKLRADKGVNFPDSNLRFSGLSQKDKEDIPFIIDNADILSFSFITTAEDVKSLYAELLKYDAKKIGVVLKIENKKAYTNLADIILTGMQYFPIGVMIARGDLAIECGWNSLAGVQEEILLLCSAAHIPIFWATQVLESVAKKGRPSRAEITDAAVSQRAECVMLNKGPHIIEAINILDTILLNMQSYQSKKAPMLPALKMPDIYNIN
ncbi:MAG: pyruvate kinase [Bacteroidota bacterium]|nr:pyruvate kinase [Bacteroidota bacterium]